MKARNLIKCCALIIVVALGGFYLYLRPKYTVPILMYHHIDYDGRTSSLSVSPENFKRQIRFLSKYRYNVISLAEFVQAKIEKQTLPRNTVVITFDDGYEDNYAFACPALKKYNLPAIIFVIVEALDSEDYLSYGQIKQMLSSGIIDIGSHTLSGGYLPGQPRQELLRQLGQSKEILGKRLNKQIGFFCYPVGGFTAEIQEMARAFGYQAACTTNRGKSKTYLNDDLFALKRIKIKDSRFNLLVFWAKVSGYYNVFRRVREPY